MLLKVKAVSKNDVWAVGNYDDGPSKTLVMHWNGAQWSIVPSPNAGKAGAALTSITVVSPHDIWAVGTFGNSIEGQNVEEPFTMHWDGALWSIVKSPGIGNFGMSVSDVAALTANDVWFVGYETATNVPLMEHWDGVRWSVINIPDYGTVVRSPNSAAYNALYAMERVPHSNSIIVTGTTYYGNGETGTVLYITRLSG